MMVPSSRGVIESKMQDLKASLESSIAQLRKDETKHQHHVTRLGQEIQQHRRSLSQQNTQSLVPLPMEKTAKRGLNLESTRESSSKSNGVLPHKSGGGCEQEIAEEGDGGGELVESWMERGEVDSDTTMDIMELDFRPPTVTKVREMGGGDWGVFMWWVWLAVQGRGSAQVAESQLEETVKARLARHRR